MVWTCNFAACHQVEGVVLSSYQIEVTLANPFKRLQLTSSAYLKVGMSLIGHRYIATAFGNMLVFGLCTQHRSSCHEDYCAAYFQKIHSLCKHSLSLAQYIMFEKEDGNEKRSLKIKFTVFAPSLGVFLSPTGLALKTDSKLLVFWILKFDDADQQNTVSRLQKRISAVPLRRHLAEKTAVMKIKLT